MKRVGCLFAYDQLSVVSPAYAFGQIIGIPTRPVSEGKDFANEVERIFR